MLRFPSWAKWQGEALYDRMRKRVPNGRSKPISLSFIAVATDLDDDDGDFLRFAEKVGGGILARGYLIALLGYMGRRSATYGVIRCDRTQLGPVALTDRTCIVSSKVGAMVYDALVASGIAEEIAEPDIREIDIPGGNPAKNVGQSSPEASPEDRGEASPPSDAARGEERRGELEDKNPPTPLTRGAGSCAGTEQPPAATPKPLGRSDRAAAEAILTRLCATPQGVTPGRDQLHYAAKRRELRSGKMLDVEILMLLRDHEHRFPEACEEARADVRRQMRQGTRERKADPSGDAGSEEDAA